MTDTKYRNSSKLRLPDASNDLDARVVKGWDADSDELVTYRYFGCNSKLIARDHSVGTMPIRSDMRTDGGLRLAPLAVAMLESAGNTLDRYYQLWLTQIEAHIFDAGVGVNAVTIDNHILREARTQAFTEGHLLASPDGRVLGHGSASWAVLSHLSSDFEYRSPGGAPVEADLLSMPQIWEVFGAQQHPQGGYSIAQLSPLIGEKILHYGPIIVLLEQTCLDQAARTAGPAEVRPKMLSCRIIRAARTGPFTFGAEIYNHTGDLITCRAQLYEGEDVMNPIAVMHWQARLF